MADKTWWLDRSENVGRLYRGLWALGLLLLLLDLVIHRHDDWVWAEIFGFYSLYGFAACVILVLTAKALRRLLKRPEDYYER